MIDIITQHLNENINTLVSPISYTPPPKPSIFKKNTSDKSSNEFVPFSGKGYTLGS